MENKNKNKISFVKIVLISALIAFVVGLIYGYHRGYGFGNVATKPVIYVYNSNNISSDVDVTIDKNNLSFEYPNRTNGWWYIKTNKEGVTVYPSKKDRDKDINGKDYNYLFWEDTTTDIFYSLDEGFCIKGKDTREFLETSLVKLGMNQREINEFIVYWLPKMENNKYNIISFQTNEYEKYYPLRVNPQPDNILRIFMVYYSSNKPIDIKTQDLESIRHGFERKGLYVVEWGGSELNGSKQ